jgi:hypothetical protein
MRLVRASTSADAVIAHCAHVRVPGRVGANISRQVELRTGTDRRLRQRRMRGWVPALLPLLSRFLWSCIQASKPKAQGPKD